MRPLANNSTVEKIIHTCSLTAKSGEASNIQIHLNGMSLEQAKKMYKIAKGAFRDVEVVSETTGEVLMSRYTASELFVPLYSYGSAINTMITICEGE